MIKVSGISENTKASHVYQLLDYFDKKHGVTAMARTTGYTASIVAQMMAKRAIEEKGVIPPERLGMSEALFKEIVNQLRKRKIEIREFTYK